MPTPLKWTEETIKDGVVGVMKQLGITVMPSRQNIVETTGGTGLLNAIVNTYGGIIALADEMHIPRDDERREEEIFLTSLRGDTIRADGKVAGDITPITEVEMRLTFRDYPCGRLQYGCSKSKEEAETCQAKCLLWKGWISRQWETETKRLSR